MCSAKIFLEEGFQWNQVSCQHLFRSGRGIHPLHPPCVRACSPVDCARELLKPSKDSASLLVWNENKVFRFFCGWRHMSGRFLAILAQITWPWAQPPDEHLTDKTNLFAPEMINIRLTCWISGSIVSLQPDTRDEHGSGLKPILAESGLDWAKKIFVA